MSYPAAITEEEARGKWCPMVRQLQATVNGTGGIETMAGVNRNHEDGKVGRCIASDCMMWRVHRYVLPNGNAAFAEDDGAIAFGFCGLAGS
jgi:hypothetical protein